MIQNWKGFDSEITDFNYQRDPTPSGGTIPNQTSSP